MLASASEDHFIDIAEVETGQYWGFISVFYLLHVAVLTKRFSQEKALLLNKKLKIWRFNSDSKASSAAELMTVFYSSLRREAVGGPVWLSDLHGRLASQEAAAGLRLWRQRGKVWKQPWSGHCQTVWFAQWLLRGSFWKNNLRRKEKHGLSRAAVPNRHQQVVYMATALYCNIVLLMILLLKAMLFYIYTLLCLNYKCCYLSNSGKLKVS